MRLLLAAASLLALAACQPDTKKAEEAKAEAMGQDSPNAPFVPAPVGPATKWEAMSKTAMSFTPGKITLTPTPQKSENLPGGMIFAAENGLTYETTLNPGGATQGGDANKVKWDDVFIVPGGKVDPEKIVLYDVDKETVPPGLTNGGLCKKTSFIATYTAPDAASGEVLTIAAFEGDQWPPASDTAFCGNFAYTPAK